MSLEQRHGKAVIEWASAGRALDDGSESGDAPMIVAFENGALVAAIDGLGHGPEAALAARTAAQILEHHARESVVSLVQRCHEVLRKTRGAVMSLASYDSRNSSLTWIGIGNVEGVLFRKNPRTEPRRQDISTRGGIVGYQLPPLRATTVAISRGDTLILTTDGIRSGFTTEVDLESNPKETAEFILAGHAKENDDALVVVVRYLGEHHEPGV